MATVAIRGPNRPRRAVCWCVTRNLYERVLPSIRSMVRHTDVDMVYLLTEDDEFPYTVPAPVRNINVSRQTYFPGSGPNYHQKWTYMVLMRAALSKVLTDEDRVLSMDADTICRGNIEKLFDLDMDGYYLAGAREPDKSRDGLYVNMGVALFNLKALRDGTDDRIIERLNRDYFQFNEQDCINTVCAGRILEIPSIYNACPWTGMGGNILIRHYAAQRNWYDEAEVRAYI